MLEIHDIKPIVEVPSYSLYLYYGSILLAILLLFTIFYLIYRYFKNKLHSKEKEYIAILQDLDYSNSKQTAYVISKYGRLLAKSDRQKRLIDDIHLMLDEFKYKKEIRKEIPDSVKGKLNTFMESLDV